MFITVFFKNGRKADEKGSEQKIPVRKRVTNTTCFGLTFTRVRGKTMELSQRQETHEGKKTSLNLKTIQNVYWTKFSTHKDRFLIHP